MFALTQRMVGWVLLQLVVSSAMSGLRLIGSAGSGWVALFLFYFIVWPFSFSCWWNPVVSVISMSGTSRRCVLSGVAHCILCQPQPYEFCPS